MPRKAFQIFLVTILLASANALANGQEVASNEVLTNEKVITMVQAGLAPGIIVTKIRTSKTSFNTSTDELIRLKQANVPDVIINVMINPTAGSAANSMAGDPNSNRPLKEIGVYQKQNND